MLLSFGEVEHQGSSDIVSLSTDIKAFFQSIGIQAFTFGGVELIVPADFAAWIPSSLYVEEDKHAYLDALSYSVPLGSMAYSCHSPKLDSHCVFVSPSSVITSFKVAMPGIAILPSLHRLSEVDLGNPSVPAILMYVREGKADVVAFSNGQLQLSNTYDATSATELLSCGLDIMHQLQIEAPSTTLFLSGNVDRNTYKVLCDYFPQVKLYNGRKLTFANPEFQHLHTYQYVLNLI